MNSTVLLTLGGITALLATIGGAGTKIKEFFLSLKTQFIQTINLDDNLSAAAYRYCRTNLKQIGFRTKVYSSCISPTRSSHTEQLLAFDMLMESSMYFRKGWRLLSISIGPWRYNEALNDYTRTVNLSLPRFMWNHEKFMQDVLKNWQHFQEKRFTIHRFCGKSKQSPTISLDDSKRSEHAYVGNRQLITEAMKGRAAPVGMECNDITLDEEFHGGPFSWYAFPPNALDVLERIRQWYSSRQWYREKHIPWRRGVLVYGKSGSGKTLFLKCVAQDLNIPIYIFDLSCMSNEEFMNFWVEAAMHAPCMILFEDFDAVFHGRKNICGKSSDLTFDCILNAVSGVDTHTGILLAITTNHIEKVDPAMGAAIGDNKHKVSPRPGRIDDVLCLENMDESCRRIMSQRILGDVFDIEAFIQETHGQTSAQFIEMCNQRAIKEKILHQASKTKVIQKEQIHEATKTH